MKKEHFDAFLGNSVHVRLIRPVDGQRDFVGKLESADEEGSVSILMDEDIEDRKSVV